MTPTEHQHLSPHFILYEFTRSGAAIDHGLTNTPGPRQVEALRQLCQHVLEPLREAFGPIVISSGYRSPLINRLVGGRPTSQHLAGEAADIVTGTPERARRMYVWLCQHADFDQLIWEPRGSRDARWLHISYTTKRPNRHQML